MLLKNLDDEIGQADIKNLFKLCKGMSWLNYDVSLSIFGEFVILLSKLFRVEKESQESISTHHNKPK